MEKSHYIHLQDKFERSFKYLRLSLTEECNFKCVYCLPDGYKRSENYDFPLTRNEIKNCVRAFVKLGFKKVRLTGGEPTLRRDIIEIVQDVASFSEIEKLALTTNGYRLSELAANLKMAGLNSINISIDSLDQERFRQITGTDKLHAVLNGIDESVKVGIQNIKCNAVLLKDTVALDLPQILSWIKDKPFSFRFIEIMQTGKNHSYFERQHVSSGNLKLKLMQEGWKIIPRTELSGPAIEFVHPDYLGSIGIIAPYSSAFCESCNRLRISSTGGIRMCLFGENEISLRSYFQDFNQTDELVQKIIQCIENKNEHHFLHDKKVGMNQTFSSIGG